MPRVSPPPTRKLGSMVHIQQYPDSNILRTKAINSLNQDDYDRILPVAEDLLRTHGKLRWYFEMEGFEGWTPTAAWTDLKFGIQHASDFEKIAMVGDKQWEKWLTQLMKPFTSAEVRFFPTAEKDAAWTWIQQ